MYLIKTPWWLRALYPTLTWRLPGEGRVIYLTFDDGPYAVATPFVLDTLKEHGAKASFFCIGKNVAAEKELYERIVAEGHSTGNHTYHHVNGWRTGNNEYIDEVKQTAELVSSNLFRPPYGRIRRSQIRLLQSEYGFRTIMWDVLSGDFDMSLKPEQSLRYVLKHTRAGSIVLFHDSEKALPRMQYALPRMLEYFTKQGFRFEAIPQ